MGRDAFLAQGRTVLGRSRHVLAQYVFEPSASQVVAASIQEELRDRGMASYGHPGPERLSPFLGEWECTLTASFSPHEHARSAVERDIVQAKADEFGDAQPRAERHVDHRPIADAVSCGRVRRRDHGLHFESRQVTDQSFLRLLGRNGEDAADLLKG